ncbi:MAG: 5-methylcytosine-specific restriction endonuclease system specificity protein McrC [Peptococcaceae bacterium]|nr:5-methylcytosine-specific restriction endonuclease system specificity protein McrC [Peptococcaceae bacterium]
MSTQPKIPIKNIYYMLCYAWDILKQDETTLTGVAKFDHIYNLLARLLINGTKNVIKRGFHRKYQEMTEELSLVRGRIEVTSTLKQLPFLNNRLVCQFDEFTANGPFNRILKTTISALLKYPELDFGLRKELTDIRYYFVRIDEIRLDPWTFSQLKYNRNNRHYQLLMNICELIYTGLITTEDSNSLKFADFIRDGKMAALFEKFVLNFYKKHLPLTKYKVHSPNIDWGLDTEYDHTGLEYLPQMRTDIVIDNNVERTQTIIDTKYYASALASGNYGEVRKLHAGNLYQIYAYVTNSPYNGAVSGMLLYPTTEHELNLDYKIKGRNIKVKTLDLSVEWEDISYRLLEIIEG